jgi:hypothetical protein
VHELVLDEKDPCAGCLLFLARLPKFEEKPTIPLGECVAWGVYKIHSRNLSVGVFNPKVGGFIGIREKLGSKFLFTEYHYDKGPPFGTVRPLEKVGDLPEGIARSEHKAHADGHLWTDGVPLTTRYEATEPGVLRPVIRRDLAEGEASHGTRDGFVDLYVDTGERLPDNVYPFGQENKELFEYLQKMEIQFGS